MLTRRAAACLVALAVSSAALAQSRGLSLVALTMNTGAVLIAEITYDSQKELRIINLDTGEEETYAKAEGYKKLSAAQAKLLPPRQSVSGKRPDELEVLRAESLPANSPDLFKRLGNYPENVGKYLAWSARKVSRGGKATVAVLPLQDTRGQTTGETVRRAEELTNELIRRGVDVVERSRLDQVAGELTKQQGVLFDDALAQQIGRQVGATAVVVGSLSPRGDKANLNLRLVEVETGRALDAATLNDMPGLPRERVAARSASSPSIPSFVGTWNVKLPNGQTTVLRAYPNKTLVIGKYQGRWDQTGYDLTVLVPSPPDAVKKGAPRLLKSVGQIGPLGNGFKVLGPNNAEVTGTRL